MRLRDLGPFQLAYTGQSIAHFAALCLDDPPPCAWSGLDGIK